jgi:competence protein ComEC
VTLLPGQRGYLFLWLPVILSVGIGIYFSSKSEPDLPVILRAGAVMIAALILAALAARRGWTNIMVFGVALVVLIAGWQLAVWRSVQVASPVLNWRYYGPVEGRIIAIDRSASDAVRITLDQVVLAKTAPNRRPAHLRISLHGDQGELPLPPGARVMTTAHLSPPAGPVEPGGFDFQRHAWFQRLGAIGYTRVPVLILEPTPSGSALILRARYGLADRVRNHLSPRVGGIAAAVMTGDRSGLDPKVVEDLRHTNLAHLLAISGLHMGLVAGFVFAALRLIGAMIPPVALHWPLRSLAAGGALAAGLGYLILSGASVATERAFVMAAVALIALIAKRRALTFRALAVAAIIVLTLRPEALTSPGFQMSFAATAALVGVFAALRPVLPRLPGWSRWGVTLLVSSSVAGLATAPIAAAHFNMIAQYGLLANLLAVPVMGILVMPAAVLAVVLMPLGAEALPLWAMGIGLEWILFVADWVAGLNGAVIHVPSPPWIVLTLYALGGIGFFLWQGRAGWMGLAPIALAAMLWVQVERPPILIDEAGQVVGVMTDAGRALSQAKGGGFVARAWMENDGLPMDQGRAADFWGDLDLVAQIQHLRGKRRAATAVCGEGMILVLTHPTPKTMARAETCHLYGPKERKAKGAVALYPILDPQGKLIGYNEKTARAQSGRRPWNDRDTRRDLLNLKARITGPIPGPPP